MSRACLALRNSPLQTHANGLYFSIVQPSPSRTKQQLRFSHLHPLHGCFWKRTWDLCLLDMTWAGLLLQSRFQMSKAPTATSSHLAHDSFQKHRPKLCPANSSCPSLSKESRINTITTQVLLWMDEILRHLRNPGMIPL